jgi:hypothetical protein
MVMVIVLVRDPRLGCARATTSTTLGMYKLFSRSLSPTATQASMHHVVGEKSASVSPILADRPGRCDSCFMRTGAYFEHGVRKATSLRAKWRSRGARAAVPCVARRSVSLVAICVFKSSTSFLDEAMKK